MSNDDERDYAEERYNRELCPECGYSPCILSCSDNSLIWGETDISYEEALDIANGD